ncbi:hypothetical protein GGF37_004358 [Kickxella alabastrina]|nr:hypothetical protein GGF37_004358 [Kickxella alabastrina]
MQPYSPTAIMDEFSRVSSGSQQADDHITALNNFLGMSSSTSNTMQPPSQSSTQQHQQRQPSLSGVSDQAMAAFLAASTTAAYTGIPAMSILSQNSPLMINPIGITPSQSLQSLQLNDFGSDAATLAAANFAVVSQQQQHQQPGSLLTSTVDMSNSLYNNNSLTNMDSESLSSMLSASAAQQQQRPTFVTVPGNYNVSSNSGFLTPTAVSYEQAAQARAQAQAQAQANFDYMMGKRKFDDTDMSILPSPMGVPLGKRVTMPASYGDYQTRPMPIPTGIGMQRIASYHPSSFGATSPLQNMDTGNALSVAPARLPINRLKTTPVNSYFSSKPSGSGKRSAGINSSNTTTFSVQPQPQPTQHQRKVAHNAIERRYRNNINDRITDLRSSVPALQHVRPKKRQSGVGSSSSSPYARDNAETSNDEDEEDDDEEDNEGGSHQVDGVEAATKLNKATILGKSTEYIYYLRRSNDQMKRESFYLQEIVRSMPDGEVILASLLLRAKQESEAATVSLRVPERATMPKKKQKPHH